MDNYPYSTSQVRNMKRLGWIEWVFLIIATFTMLGLLGMSIERFISIHNSFMNFTPASGGGSGDGNGSVFEIGGQGLDEGVGANSSMTDCDVWTCLNDFLFALLLLLNLGKANVHTCVYVWLCIKWWSYHQLLVQKIVYTLHKRI